ncbi:MAG: M6 family metalloprotease domain-containing protein [bacterium]
MKMARGSRAFCLALGAVCGAVIVAATTLWAMPLRPDIVDRLRVEGKMAEEATLEQAARARGVNNLGENKVYHIAPGASLMSTSRQAIVILVDFSDNVADTVTYPSSHYTDLLFSVGSYPTGSMRDYYLENSYGNFTVTGQVTAWLRLPETYAYYVDGQRGFGDYPQNCQKMVEDAVEAANAYVDFSQYDNDGPDGIPDSGDDDGYVDALFVVHAGPGYEQTHDLNDVHSHAWSTYYDVEADGVYVSPYSMEPDNGKIGVFCHEFGHVLGCPDLYDYGYDSRGVGDWSLMAFGCWGNGGITPTHIDAWDKDLLGFLAPIVPTGSLIDIPVPKVEDHAVAYKVWTGGSPSNEYFLVENRQATMFDAYMPGSGFVIYHVDENMWDNDSQRCGSGSPHYLVAVEQADGECDLEYYVNRGDAGDPWPGSGGTHNPNHAFNLLSTPNTRNYANSATGVSIYNIHFAGQTGYLSIAVAAVAPTVVVVAPNGGEAQEVGQPDTVRWIAFDDLVVDSVSVLLSRDGGATYPEVLAHGEPNDSALVWTVTGPVTTAARIKVVAYDRSGYSAADVSNANFQIYDVSGAPKLDVAELRILSVVPNPTRGGAQIAFSSPDRGARVSVYDVTGRLVAALDVQSAESMESEAGLFEAAWDGTDTRGAAMSPGVYFLRVASAREARTARLTITRSGITRHQVGLRADLLGWSRLTAPPCRS